MLDRLEESLVILEFDVFEGFGRGRELLRNFSELTLVWVDLSRAHLSEDSEDDSSQSESPSQILVMRAPLTGKRARAEVGGTSRRAVARTKDNVLSLALLSGPV